MAEILQNNNVLDNLGILNNNRGKGHANTYFDFIDYDVPRTSTSLN